MRSSSRAPAALGGDDAAARTRRSAGVDEVVDVLPGGALAAGVRAGPRRRAGRRRAPTAWRSTTSARSAHGSPALGRASGAGRPGRTAGRRPSPAGAAGPPAPVRRSGGRLGHDRQHVTGLHGVAHGDPHLGDGARGAGVDGVLHLHRLDDHARAWRGRPPRRPRARRGPRSRSAGTRRLPCGVVVAAPGRRSRSSADAGDVTAGRPRARRGLGRGCRRPRRRVAVPSTPSQEVTAMARCEVCGNDYDKAFEVVGGR